MGLQENLRIERVGQLKLRDPVTVRENTLVRDAVTLMRNQNIGCAIVIDGERKPIGIFTESMLTEMVAHDVAGLNQPLEKHMAERCPWVKTTDPIADVLEAMQLKNTRLLCVVDEQGCVVGLTGQRGLMEYVAEHFPGEVMVQRIGQPSYLSDREGA
jgi:CBS domain-containing protein